MRSVAFTRASVRGHAPVHLPPGPSDRTGSDESHADAPSAPQWTGLSDYVQHHWYAWIPCFLNRCHVRGRPGPPAHPTCRRGDRETGARSGSRHERRAGGRAGGAPAGRRVVRPRQHPVAAPRPLDGDRASGTPVEQGLSPRGVRHFSLVGVIWDDPDAELHGRVQVRTRAVGTGTWSGWQDVETHNAEHAADPGTDERTSGRVRGSTAPLWVGESDGVEVRVTPEVAGAAGPGPTGEPETAAEEPEDGVRGSGDDTAARPEAASTLPDGLRLELVDPGDPAPAQGATPPAPPAPERSTPRPSRPPSHWPPPPPTSTSRPSAPPRSPSSAGPPPSGSCWRCAVPS